LDWPTRDASDLVLSVSLPVFHLPRQHRQALLERRSKRRTILRAVNFSDSG